MEPLSAFSYGASGQGTYGRSMGPGMHECISVMKERILAAVDSIPIHKERDPVFVMADYGTNDGYVSMPLIHQIIEAVRRKHSDLPIQIVFEDQPSNDFNSLFRIIHGLIPDCPSYLTDFQGVYMMASGTNFFQKVIPDNTAHLIMSFCAVQHISKAAVKFQNSLHRFPDATETERRLVEAQAAEDWQTFLLHRAKELKSGGVLIVSTPAEDPEMKIEGVRHCIQGYEECMLNIWRRMRDEGKITQEEFVDTNIYQCVPYLREMTAPFEAPGSQVTAAGLRLMHAHTVLVPCVAQAAWQEKMDREGQDDRATWARAIVEEHKAWSYQVFIRGLSNTRSQPEKEAVVDELNDRLETEIACHDPRQFKSGYLMNYVFVRKT